MSEPIIPAVPGPLYEDVAALLRVVVEGLDIPAPATVGDTEQYRAILDRRVMHVVVAIEAVLNDPTGLGTQWTADYLRRKLSEHPPTGYRPWDAPPSQPDGEVER
ncbi:hypothetical protein [Streptomyces sp. Inha503]|uniref:hypothetical protein n=1 Tax=Streptomyces sp. Inha503 TaxID=3383314 RepID=UPI0039A2AF74